MTDKSKPIDFGTTDGFGEHVFRVEIPTTKSDLVCIVEHYGYQGGEKGIPIEEERVRLHRAVWSAIAETARKDFNERLKVKNMVTGRWKIGKNNIDRLLGKELCVLGWAAERAKPEELPVICSKWAALRPEERWWLFTMTVAEAGLPEDSERGWRKALYFALSDGTPEQSSRKRHRPAEEPDLMELPLFRTVQL